MADVTETCAAHQDVIAQYKKEQEEERKALLTPQITIPVPTLLAVAQARALQA